MSGSEIIFEQIRSSGCLSYLIGCAKEKICAVIDPELDKAADYLSLADFFKSKLVYAIDTHTHADHNSACKLMRERYGVQVVMHCATDAPYVDIKVNDGAGRGIWPRDVLKEVSRGLSRVEAGNPGFPRLVQVTSGGFSWWL